MANVLKIVDVDNRNVRDICRNVFYMDPIIRDVLWLAFEQLAGDHIVRLNLVAFHRDHQ